MRFEIEKALVEGSLKVTDLPEVWNQKIKEYLGIKVPNNRLGVLQDVHWSSGAIGIFPPTHLEICILRNSTMLYARTYPTLTHCFKMVILHPFVSGSAKIFTSTEGDMSRRLSSDERPGLLSLSHRLSRILRKSTLQYMDLNNLRVVSRSNKCHGIH
jgi:hypothetical protein